MQISDLSASNSFGSSDVLAIEVGGVTYKLTGATLATALSTLGNYLTSTTMGNPIDIAHGGTNATTAAGAKASLGLGTSAQNLTLDNFGTSNGIWGITAASRNSNNATYNGTRMSLVLNNDGISLWDGGGSSTVWAINPSYVRAGYTTITSFSANANTDKTVTFPTFPNFVGTSYAVIIQQSATGALTKLTQLYPMATGLQQAQFTLRVYNNGSAISSAAAFHWIAVAYT